jgi:hypothetical protein
MPRDVAKGGFRQGARYIWRRFDTRRGRFRDDSFGLRLNRELRSTCPCAPCRKPVDLTRASDTASAAQLAQVAAARRLGQEGRLRIAAELSEDARRISIAKTPRVLVRASAPASSAKVVGRIAGHSSLASFCSMSDLKRAPTARRTGTTTRERSLHDRRLLRERRTWSAESHAGPRYRH